MIYPIDPTGVSPNNLILEEINVIMPPMAVTDATFFVPRVTPFFRLGLIITHGARQLYENIDYQLVFRSVALSTHFEHELFGGVMFINRDFSGTVKMTYQVLGGDFQNDDAGLLERLARLTGSIRWITYDQISGLPNSFPPAYHMHDIETDLVDMGDVVDAVDRIATALEQQPATSLSEMSGRLDNHINLPSAHTKSQVGLGAVENLSIATLPEVISGVRKYVTADVLLQYQPELNPDNDVSPLDFYNLQQTVNTLGQEVARLGELHIGGSPTPVPTPNPTPVPPPVAETYTVTATRDDADAVFVVQSSIAGSTTNLTWGSNQISHTNTHAVTTAITQLVNGKTTLRVPHDDIYPTFNTRVYLYINGITAGSVLFLATGGGVSGSPIAEISTNVTSEHTGRGNVNIANSTPVRSGIDMTLARTDPAKYTIGLPANFDRLVNRVEVVTGGTYNIDYDAKTVTVIPAYVTGEYDYQVGDADHTGTYYLYNGSITVRVF